jgi:hypothetical protein
MADWMDESVDEGSLTEEDHYALGRAPEPSSDASSDIRSFLVSPVPSHSQPGANPAAAGASSSASSSSQANDSQQSWSLPSQSQSQSSSSSSARAREPPRVIVSSTFAEGGAPSAWPPPVTAPLRDWAWGSEHLRLPCAVENTVRGPVFFFVLFLKYIYIYIFFFFFFFFQKLTAHPTQTQTNQTPRRPSHTVYFTVRERAGCAGQDMAVAADCGDAALGVRARAPCPACPRRQQ